MESARTALVVGASSAIGSAVARALTADAYDCVLWGRDRVADAVRWVVSTPAHVCPVEIELQPQRTP